jgi:PelA/Pel-15E family pectate lyase
MLYRIVCLMASCAATWSPGPLVAQEPLARQAVEGMRRATAYFRQHVAVQGGYVYLVSIDGRIREGEGAASPTEVWVQPPGTPAVGMAYVQAYRATGDAYFLESAKEVANCLVQGQLKSGGWNASIEFDPKGKNAGSLRSGKGNPKSKQWSSLDDDKSQSAIRLLMHVDRLLESKDAPIHEAAQAALDALLEHQFANGGFPQAWNESLPKTEVLAASFPEYEWRTEHREKEYWRHYTLNDGLAGTVSQVLIDAAEIYRDERYRRGLERLGDFLILSQMPAPQAAWAQQYNFQMHPAWARKFEPPAISGHESQDAIQALLRIYDHTRNEKYLEPIPRAIQWLRQSALPDGRLARFYELRTNRPLYMTRQYELTYQDDDLPTHYSFKGPLKADSLEATYLAAKSGKLKAVEKPASKSDARVREILGLLDSQGRWLTDKKGKSLSKQEAAKEAFLLSKIFIEHMEVLSDYVAVATDRRQSSKQVGN